MKTVICAAMLVLLVLPLSAAAHGRRDKHYDRERVERVPARGEVHVVFSRGDVGVLREYYAPRYRNLPPGLQKKMQPCPPDLERMLPPPPPNYAHVVIGGNLVLLNRANFQIADVFHLEIN